MPVLPDQSMIDVASRVINLLGDSMGFQRYTGSAWVELESVNRVYIQPRDSLYRRSFRGFESSIGFAGFAGATADIRNGDRTVISSSYFIVDALENRGTHLEFRLKQTDEIQDI